MVIYKWTIPICEYESETGLIKTVHWRVTAEDGNYTSSSYGTVSFGPIPEGREVTPFKSLTEEQVLKWVWLSVKKEDTEVALATKIESQKNPPVKAGTPWGA